MNEITLHLHASGNTIVGGIWKDYVAFDKAVKAKSVFVPSGFVIKATNADFFRLVEYVQLFGNCIKTLAGFRKACNLAGISLEKDKLAR